MSIEASLPMLLAILGVSCSVFGVNTLVMGRLCRSKGIELSREDIRQMRQGYVSVAVALVCLIVLVATSVLSLIDARVGLALIAFELVGAGVGAFTAKKSVDDNWERIKEKQQINRNHNAHCIKPKKLEECAVERTELVNRLIAHKPEIEQLHAKLGAVETKERKQ